MQDANKSQTLFRLESSIKDYAWGDVRRLVELFDLENPQCKPQAEIWMGAHPADPSRAITANGKVPLDALIAREPNRMLGEDVRRRFGDHLPFLFKVLNAGQPLSIQLHPDKATAQAGFEREEAAGVPRDAPHRNYVDPNHKPELICALTPFRALCGFRPIADICEALELAQAHELGGALSRLQSEADEASLRDLCLCLLQLEVSAVETMLERALVCANDLDRTDFNELCLLHEYYPGDRGVMFALLLNLVELEPGEAMFLSAGHMHSYLDGVGLEIMASSDNVIRGGLTPKHVDCAELSRLAKFEPLPEESLRVTLERRDAQTVYATPIEDFTLSLVEVTAVPAVFLTASAEVLLCLSGHCTVKNGGEQLVLAPGQACFVAAAANQFELRGEGNVARAAVKIP